MTKKTTNNNVPQKINNSIGETYNSSKTPILNKKLSEVDLAILVQDWDNLCKLFEISGYN
jgi:hypothetical protein